MATPDQRVHVIDAQAFEERIGVLLSAFEERVDRAEGRVLSSDEVRDIVLRAIEPVRSAFEQHDKWERRIVVEAFVDGDPTAHRKAHEAAIAAAQAERDFWDGLRRDLMRKGLIAILLCLLGLVAIGALAALAGKLGIAWKP